MALSTTNTLSAFPLSSTLKSQFLPEPLPRFNMEKSLAHEAAYQYGRSEAKTKRYTTTMAIVKTQPNKDIPLVPFGSRFLTEPLPRYEMPEKSLPKEAAYQIIHDELMLDGNPRFDLCTFVTTWMEEEADKLMDEAMSKNFIAMPEYPVTTELEKRCVNMIARLFNAPLGEKESAIGVSTIGSSEAIMLAGLALKRKWQIKMKSQGKPYDKPNLICGANVQVCWEKFCNYFEVEIRYVNVKEGYYIMDPQKAVDLVDENTICIAAILGSTYNGEYEDVKAINDLLEVKNKATGWDTPIHVDAASGGFVAPFITPDLVWDFKLPWVKSINVSGHKYGLVYAGVAWNIWRTKDDLPEELIFHINYLGDDQATFTLNFSKASSQVVAQYYNLVRLGKRGYKNIIKDCMTIAQAITDGVEETGHFNIVSNLANGIPLVAFSLKDSSLYTETTISNLLRAKGWLIPAYNMPEDATNVKVLRAVIREDFSGTLVERFIDDLNQILKDLDGVIEKVKAKAKLGARGDVAHEVKKEIARIWGDEKAEWKNKKTIAIC